MQFDTLFRQVAVGSNWHEVSKSLGTPAEPEGGIVSGAAGMIVTYEGPKLNCAICEEAYKYRIWIDPNGVVLIAERPFGDSVSLTGIPTIPTIIWPCSRDVFAHYPRLIDVRWHPSHGVYPISYELELQHEDRHGAFFTNAPYTGVRSLVHTINFPGCQRGRIRVRACNDLGKSEWSEVVEIEFLV